MAITEAKLNYGLALQVVIKHCFAIQLTKSTWIIIPTLLHESFLVTPLFSIRGGSTSTPPLTVPVSTVAPLPPLKIHLQGRFY